MTLTVDLRPVAAYLRALCEMNDWRSIRIDAGEPAGLLLYRRGEGCVLVGTEHKLTDAEITGWEELTKEAKDL
jgi:hypothetical protein